MSPSTYETYFDEGSFDSGTEGGGRRVGRQAGVGVGGWGLCEGEERWPL